MRSGMIDHPVENTDIEMPDIKLQQKKKVQKRHIVKMIIWLFVFLFIAYQIYVLAMYTLGKREKEKMWLYNGVNSFMGLFVKKEPSQTTEDFHLKMAATGDIYATANMIKGAKTSNGYDFSAGSQKIAEKLKTYDLVVGSLSTPIASVSLGYSSKDTYNAPAELLDTLKQLNISALATATYHAMDKKEVGIKQTLEALNNVELKQTGIDTQERSKPLILEKNGIKIGMMSYATSLNVKMSANQDFLVNLLTDENLDTDITYLKTNDVDFIIAYLNVPNEDVLLVNGTQKKSVEKLFDAGVNIVLGTGSLVVQEGTEDYLDPQDSSTHVYTIYSLGDFMGSYVTDDNQLSVIPSFQFEKKVTKDKNGTILKEEKIFEVLDVEGIWTSVDKNYHKTMYLLKDEIEAYNNDQSTLTAKEYEKLKTASGRIKELFNLQ